jgi:uncharacterized membrane protein
MASHLIRQKGAPYILLVLGTLAVVVASIALVLWGSPRAPMTVIGLACAAAITLYMVQEPL